MEFEQEAPPHTPTGPWGEFPDSYWAAYFGKQAPYYLHQLHRLQEGGWPLFHVPAFFLGFFWMAYRRMYLVALSFILLVMLEGTVEEGIFYLIGIGDQAAQWSGRLLSLLISLLVGSFANRVYLWDARRQIRAAMRTGPLHVEELRLAHIAERGGTSWKAVLVCIVLIIFAFLVVMNLYDMVDQFYLR